MSAFWGTRRLHIQEDGEVLRVVLPPSRGTSPAGVVAASVLVLYLLVTWPRAACWLVALSDSGRWGALARPALGASILMGLFWLFASLWVIFGREVLELGPETLIHQRLLFGVGGTSTYDVPRIKNLRVERLELLLPAFLYGGHGGSGRRRGTGSFGDQMGLSGGLLAFDYDSWTYRCGAALDEPEAKQIIERFGQRDARLRPPAA